ncbi:nickel pincer cofactor biosynthesis protein LarB [Streptococcus iners]|uniref:Nickel pincer cofactor biosynthesis protein LarB n=1 Tax=Streptococcus iners subsp. hyiners TaxID=3028083 RepID=A0AA97AD41_9STRE|nr:nickel pincer cofactor biosynthesis protein LarB [Streptococcus sp. 29892]MCK4029099.1 nickel pincer cofactor biosynthesis protein LarB [Streptococcus suis]WNY49866.1 nickel pincer cofactor biosynthesis protein LarB [Streptococcus sp. 29892]
MDLGKMSHVDLDRINIKGFPEIIYGLHKTPLQILEVALKLDAANQPVMITKLSFDKWKELEDKPPNGSYFESSQIWYNRPFPTMKNGKILVLSAGTSDSQVVEEAAVVSQWMGCQTDVLQDVGVAGLGRLLGQLETIREASVIIVVAGMEGALPSVVSGLVSVPVIAVPTSVGYGANLDGLTTLLAMTTSCSSGISVVNIDNGFGAAYQASLIIKLMNQD